MQGFGQQTHKSKWLGGSDGAPTDESGDASEPAPAAKAAAPAAKAAEPTPARTTTTTTAAAAPAPRATKTDDVYALANRIDLARTCPEPLTSLPWTLCGTMQAPPAAHAPAASSEDDPPVFKPKLRSVPKSATGDPVSSSSKTAAPADEVGRSSAP